MGDYPLMNRAHVEENEPSWIDVSRVLRPIACITCEIIGDNR